MKNRINTQKISPMNVNHIQENSILRKNKSPLATFIATALFVFGSAHAIAAPGDKPTYMDQTIGTDEKSAKLEITDDQRVQDMVIHHGGALSMSGKAEAYRTKVLDKGQLYLSGYKPIAFETQIESGGLLLLASGATADGVIVKHGGKISTIGSLGQGENGPIVLKNATIEGILELDNNSTELEGINSFLVGSKLEVSDTSLDDEISVKNNGEIIFSNNMEIAAGIKGGGSITIQKDPSGNPDEIKLILIGRNINEPDDADYDYSGATLLMDGSTLQIKEATFHNSPIQGIGPVAAELWIGEIGSDNSSYLRTTVQGSTNVSILNNSQWEMTGNSAIYNLNLSSRGRVNLSHNNKPGNILTIGENYNSDNQSLLEFNTQLGDDDSPTDRMIVMGNTSGKTNVKVNNISGAGDKTNLGILLIQVLGNSNGEFIQSGRIKAGAFEYKLGRGEDNLHKNWYLHSKLADYAVDNNKPTDAEPNNNPPAKKPFGYDLLNFILDEALKAELKAEAVDGDHTASKIPEPPLAHTADEKSDAEDALPAAKIVTKTVTNDNTSKTKVATATNTSSNTSSPSQPQVYAPENGSYIANIVMARNLFNTRLDDRSGSYHYKDANGQWRTSSMWIRTQGGRNNFGHAVDQLDINGKYYSVQLGMDVIQEGSGRLGVLAGLGKATNHSHSKVTGYYSNGAVNGYNLGVYATWLPEQKDNTGFYIDTLAQYSWFNNTVNGQEQAEDKYKSSGFTTSIESGYTFKIAETNQLGYFIQPNAQITLQGIRAQTHKTAYNELISDDNKGHMVTRIGAKTYLQTINNQDSQFMPFIAVNWLRQNQNTGAIISGQRIESKSTNSTEFKIGVESNIGQQLNIWATLDHQMGRYNDKNTNALAGIKYHF
ncbi:autotransporter outer membrane beta-barrel domain-containing protein [Yersinia bercovieri]|uniref:autotransporter outer membrane beta-barrel domain-containing protein n=1 Tax=Yersinia bercovieri TaxID=634 RepID=UPI0005E73E49|nr:autotransporter outer membrane beta-barrel domain-containing protein [Yersinia bercovieri]CFQ36374.1 putative pertactin family virulence factor/autotransporter [Yersinia bercovieri]